MSSNEEITEERRESYNEQSRLLLARLMSEKSGMLMKDAKPEEIESRQLEFLRDMMVLDAKYIDVIRDDWGFDANDETATFGEDFDKRWDHFIKNHIVKNNGKDTILYKDKIGRYRLIPNKYPDIDGLEFVMKNFNSIYIEEDLDTLEKMPSITIFGIEGISSDKYKQYNVMYTDDNFFIRQVMILTGELLDIIGRHRDELKSDELFKVLEQKYKEIF